MASRIGEFLVRIGAMSQQQVDHVLSLQKAGDHRIFGEIALELHYLNDDAIKRYVDHMERFSPSSEADQDKGSGR